MGSQRSASSADGRTDPTVILVRSVLLVDGRRVGRLYRRGPLHVVLQDGTTLPYEFDTPDAALEFVRGLARIGCTAGAAEPEGPTP